MDSYLSLKGEIRAQPLLFTKAGFSNSNLLLSTALKLSILSPFQTNEEKEPYVNCVCGWISDTNGTGWRLSHGQHLDCTTQSGLVQGVV